MVGRGTRIPDDINNLVEAGKQGLSIAKEYCLVMDFVDASARHCLVTLPTLFGLGPQLDLGRNTVTEVMEEVRRIKERKPAIDLTPVEDAAKLQGYAESVDMFKVAYQPEIIQYSEFQWHKTGQNCYCYCC
jgi:hypothetical protein